MIKHLFKVYFLLCSLVLSAQDDYHVWDATHHLSNTINAITFDQQYIWLASNEGVFRVAQSLEENEKRELRATTVPVLTIAKVRKEYWIGLQEKGLYKINPINFELTGLYRDALGRSTIDKIYPKQDYVLVKTANGAYKIDLEDGSCKKIPQVDFENHKSEPEIFQLKGDTVEIFGLPYLNWLNTKDLSLEAQSENYLVFRSAEHWKIFDVREKSVADITTGSTINSVAFWNNQLFLATDKGLWQKKTLTFQNKVIQYTSKADAPVQKFIVKSLKVNKVAIQSGDKAPFSEKSTLTVALATKNMGTAQEVNYAWSTDQINWQNTTDSIIGFKDLLPGNHHYYFKAQNLSGDESEIIAINFKIKSPINWDLWNVLIALVVLIGYSFGLVFLFTRKKNKDIRILEDTLLEKNNKLQKLEKAKYGLVDDAKLPDKL